MELVTDKTQTENISDWFGADKDETNAMNKNVIDRRTSMLDETDPISTRIKESANTQSRAAAATKASMGGGNLSVGEQSQIKRSAESDANQALSANKNESLDKYSNMASSIAKNTLGLQYGQNALNLDVGDSGGMTVICTALHRRGYLSDDIMVHDHNFGIEVRKNNPEIYAGYLMWAKHIARIMDQSSSVAFIVSLAGVPWAQEMAYGNNKFGKLINTIGMPVCGFLGKLFGGRYAKSNV